MKFHWTVSIFTFLLLLIFTASFAVAAGHTLVVVRPGGPSQSEQALQQIDRLAKQIAEKSGWDSASTVGKYFNDEKQAVDFINAESPSLVLGSTGFYLKYKDALGLSVINQAILGGKTTSQWYVVIKKGSASSLEDLKDKTLAGAALEEPEFVERIILEGKVPFGEVKIKSYRSLRALKKLAKGEVDAVVLDQKEYEALSSLPFAGDLETLFTSKAIQNNGFMVIKGRVSGKELAGFKKAAEAFCSYEDAKGICSDIDIQGFSPVTDNAFNALRNQYKGK